MANSTPYSYSGGFNASALLQKLGTTRGRNLRGDNPFGFLQGFGQEAHGGGMQISDTGRSVHLQGPSSGSGRGLQGQLAAMADWMQHSKIVEGENKARGQFREDLANKIGGLEGEKSRMMQEIMGGVEAGAGKMEATAGANWDEFVGFRDKQMEEIRGLGQKGADWAEKAYEEYDENSYASVAASASGISARVQSQEQQIRNNAAAQGLSPGQTEQLVQQARAQGSQALQSTVAPLIDQRNQIKAELATKVGSSYSNFGNMMAGASTAFGAQTVQASQLRQQAVQNAALFRRDSAMQAAEVGVRYNQMVMQGYNQLADAMKNLPPSYVSMFDTVLQAHYAQQEMGGRGPLFAT